MARRHRCFFVFALIGVFLPGTAGFAALVLKENRRTKAHSQASRNAPCSRSLARAAEVHPSVRDTGVENLREVYEPHEDPDPYAPMWRELTAKPRRCFDMDPIAWGAFPESEDPEENLTCDAAELADRG